METWFQSEPRNTLKFSLKATPSLQCILSGRTLLSVSQETSTERKMGKIPKKKRRIHEARMEREEKQINLKMKPERRPGYPVAGASPRGRQVGVGASRRTADGRSGGRRPRSANTWRLLSHSATGPGGRPNPLAYAEPITHSQIVHIAHNVYANTNSSWYMAIFRQRIAEATASESCSSHKKCRR